VKRNDDGLDGNAACTARARIAAHQLNSPAPSSVERTSEGSQKFMATSPPENNEDSLHVPSNDRMMAFLRTIIHLSVRVLAVAMTVVILFGVVDVFYVVYGRLTTPPMYIMEITDLLATFGAFMAVLIAIEIFVNITIYLRDDVIHVKIVLATALMAVARKVIILDFDDVDVLKVFSLAALVVAVSVGYWLVVVLDKERVPMPTLGQRASARKQATAESKDER